MLWFSDEYDGFLSVNRKLVLWSSMDKLLDFVQEKKIVLDDDIAIFDFNTLKCTVGCCEECKKVLDFWNIFSDLARTVGKSFIGDEVKFNNIYEKIFMGCNLPALNQLDHTVLWEEKDFFEIKKVLSNGVSVFFQAIDESV